MGSKKYNLGSKKNTYCNGTKLKKLGIETIWLKNRGTQFDHKKRQPDA